MGQKDITQKTLESHNDVFADIINGIVFDGNDVVKEDELFDTPDMSSFRAGKKITNQERDVTKLWKENNIRIALWGVENQTNPEKNMPLRVISYDGASYKRQILDYESRLRKAKDTTHKELMPEEYYPVITFVIYLGDKPWNKNKSLMEVLNIRPELRQYVNDYKLNLIDLSELPEDRVGLFKSDFRSLIDWLKNKKDPNYKVLDRKLAHKEDFTDLLYAMSGDERVYEAVNNHDDEGDNITMCEFIDRLREKGREEEREKNNKENLKKAKALVEAGTAKEIVAKIMDVNIALL